MKCPKCETENEDNWPLNINGKIKDGGCQLCWETECSISWWDAVSQIRKNKGKLN